MKNIFNIKFTANVLTVAALFLSATPATAKKMNYPIEALIGMADVIVTGRIANVSGDTSYLFNISETIKGLPSRQIRVKMFQDWACDIRWKKAIPGQELLLFLKKSENAYNIINGSDGEMFIVDSKLQMYNVFNYYSSQYFDETHSPKITEVISSIRNFVTCFSFFYTEGALPLIRQLKSDKDVDALKNSNLFSIWLFKRLTDRENYKIIKSSTAYCPHGITRSAASKYTAS